MKKQSWLAAVFIAVILTLLGISVYSIKAKDNTGPVITFGSEALVYTQGEPEDVLLADVTAIDAVDGQVDVYIENIFPLQGQEQAKVYYVAIDKSGNITKISRVIDYIPLPGEMEDDVDGDADLEGEDEETENINMDEMDNDLPDEDSSSGEEENVQEEDTKDPSIPVVVLSASEVTIAAGETFYYMTYIEDLVDDIDDFAYLSRRITVTGADFNTSEPGTYTVEYFIIDSDWNTSEVAVLTVHVQ